MRLKPRENPEVNQWWICDAGRYGYKLIDHNRITKPMIRKDSASVREADWEEILSEAVNQIREAQNRIGIFLSPQLSNEELYLAKKLFQDELECSQIFLLSPYPEGDQDDFLIRADKNPNTKGAEWLGFTSKPEDVSRFTQSYQEGKIEGIVIFGQDLLTRWGSRVSEPILRELKWSLFIGSNHNVTSEASSSVLPAAAYAEKYGTFTNFQGRVQKFNQAFEPLTESRPEWAILVELARRLGMIWAYENEEDIFNDLVRQEAAFRGLSYAKLSLQGALVNGKK